MRILLFLPLLFVASAPPHVDPFPPVAPATTEARPRWPLVCDPTLHNVVQFRWLPASDEVTDQAAVEVQLRDTAEGVNWLFWRDSNSPTEARLPAWKVTPDCRLDVRFTDAPPGGTIPPSGKTKLILVEPDDSYCGYAYIVPDDRPGPDNAHNGSGFAAVSRRCLSSLIVAHELLHLLGAVQPTAPHGTEDFHSSELDIMGQLSNSNRCRVYDIIDCNHDDYFSLVPDDKFTQRWNSANSVFLVNVPKYILPAPLHMR